MMRTYENLDLLIERGTAGGYRARVLASPAGETSAVAVTLPFSDLELENFLLRIGRPRRHAVRGMDSPEVEAIERFGGRLLDAVFPDPLRDLLNDSVTETERQGTGLRVRLRLTDCPELADLPWEYLYNDVTRRYLALSPWTPVVRYLDLPGRIRPLAVHPPLRILVMTASPTDFDPLDVDGEWAKVRDALADLQSAGRVSVERVPDGTLKQLRQTLRRGDYHVFHFIGHGRYDPQRMDGVLALEGAGGRAQQLSGADLGAMLHDHRSLRLALLNSCEGARGGRSDPYSGTAQSLVHQGIPAVVAMQFEITDRAAVTFSHSLYAAVADGYPLDAAVSEARNAIRDEHNPVEWATPVLYLRAPDGQIFDLDVTPDRPIPPRNGDGAPHLGAGTGHGPSGDDGGGPVREEVRPPKPRRPTLPLPTRPLQRSGPPGGATAPPPVRRRTEAAEPPPGTGPAGAPPGLPQEPHSSGPTGISGGRRAALIVALILGVLGAAIIGFVVLAEDPVEPPARVPGLPSAAPLPGDTLVVSMNVDDNVDLYLLDAKTDTVGRRLTTAPTEDFVPLISPDRGSIVYLHAVGDGSNTVRVVAADGTGDRALWAETPEECADEIFQPAWNPVATTVLAVSCRDAAGNRSLQLVDVDGEPLRELPTPMGVVDDVAFSPDGELVTFWAAAQRELQGGSLWSVRADGSGEPVQLTDVGPGVDADPAWSPDGDVIAFRRLVDGDADLFVMAADGSDERALAEEPTYESDPTWSPDGGRIAFVSSSSADDEASLWVIAADGSDPRELLSDAPGSLTFSAAWSRR